MKGIFSSSSQGVYAPLPEAEILVLELKSKKKKLKKKNKQTNTFKRLVSVMQAYPPVPGAWPASIYCFGYSYLNHKGLKASLT